MNLEQSALDRAVEAYRTGSLEEAARMAKGIVDSNPRDVWANFLLSLIARKRGDPVAEAEYLERCLAADESHIESLAALANLKRRMGDPDAAILLCERILAQDPDFENGHVILGLCLQMKSDHERALAALDRALVLKPRQPPLYVARAVSLRQLGRPAEATASYRQALALDPSQADAHEGLGHLMLYAERQAEAVRHFQRALDLEPDSPARLLHLAEAKGRRGLTQESIQLIRRALAVEPESGAAHCLMGLRLQDLGEFPAAIEAFEHSLQARPDQGQAYLGIFTSKRASLEDHPAIDRMAELAEGDCLAPAEQVRLRTALSKAFDDLRDWERAVREMDEANRVARDEVRGAMPFNRRATRAYAEGVMAACGSGLAWPEPVSLSRKPLLIIGLPRSGTTLVEQILSGHPEVAAGGELRYWFDAHSDEKEGLVGLIANPTRAVEVARGYESLLDSLGPGSSFVTDKMPTNFLNVGIIQLLFPNARIIHCRRDARDNCVSLYMTPFRHRPSFTYSREDILFYYRLYSDVMGHWRGMLSLERMLEVRYESLVNDLEGEVRRILAFCGLEFCDACLHPEARDRSVNTPSNWQTRQPIYTSSIGRWKRYEPWLGVLSDV